MLVLGRVCSDIVLCNENELTEIPFLIPKQRNVFFFSIAQLVSIDG